MNGPLDPNNQHFQWMDSGFINFLVILGFIVIIGALLFNAQMTENIAYHIGGV